MTVTIILPPDILALAHVTAEERPKNIRHRVPSNDPLADLTGAIVEHAFVLHCGLSQRLVDSSGGPLGRGDGGWDFTFKDGKVKVDVKGSRKYKDSFVVPGRYKDRKGNVTENLRADWYVFAYVTLPDTVEFRWKAPREMLLPIQTGEYIPYKRLAGRGELLPFHEEDFKTQIPRRPPIH